MNNFRNEPFPQRTCTKEYKRYSSFKSYLRSDFHQKCGYTGCGDFWFGGSKTFHIDHFKPQSKFPALSTSYGNLVYACSYVNIQKSDDDGDYIDPCNVDYNLHFERDNLGNIYPKKESSSANYMYTKLKLFLKRYQIIWMLEELESKITALGNLIKAEKDSVTRNDLLQAYFELTEEFFAYKKFLSVEQ